MPELPEVETVRRGLTPVLEGTIIAKAEAFRPDLRFPLPVDLGEKLKGRHIISVDRRAKYLLIRLSGGLILLSHLGMPKCESRIKPPDSRISKYFARRSTLIICLPLSFSPKSTGSGNRKSGLKASAFAIIVPSSTGVRPRRTVSTSGNSGI